MNQIYLAVNGQQQGPYTLDQVRQMTARGEISRDALAWHAGLPEWVPLGQLLDSGVPPPPLAPQFAAIMAEFTFTKDELRRMAKNQNLLMWSLLAGIGAHLILYVIPALGLLAYLGAVVFEIVALYKLGRSLRMTAPWAYCILLVIPLVSLITLFVISGKASKVLQVHGVSIGFMGGNAADIED